MGRPVIHDPEDPRGGAVGLLGHHLAHEAFERGDAGRALAAPMDLGAPHVPRRQVGPGAFPLILVLDPHRGPRCGRQGGMAPLAGLDAGLLVGRDHAVRCGQRGPVPDALVEVGHPPGFLAEGRVPREEPTAMTPRPEGVLGQPPPQGRLADRRHQPPADDFAPDVWKAQARERQAVLVGQRARQRFNRDHHAGGKSAPDARPARVLPARRPLRRRSACATC